MKKRSLSLFMAAVVIFSCLMLVSCPEEEVDFEVTSETAAIDYSPYAGTTINVYNWGEYISDGSEGTVDVNKAFTKLTGIEVNYTNFSGNEDMYSKLKSGGISYDVIIPSDYMIERLISEGMLLKLNFNNIPNYKYISEEYRNLYFDSDNEYSVPYNVGMVGIIYNTEMVSSAPDSWSVLCDPALSDKILMFNNPRDAFAIAQFMLDIDINTQNADDWEKAKEWLMNQKNYVKSYVMDEVFNKMESGSAAVAPYYAGDFLSMYQNNDDLAFVYPKEGTNIFVDSACIPTSAKNKAAAELYINFLLDPNVALQNAQTICYASPNTAVVENEDYQNFLKELHPEANAILYPSFEELYPGKDVNDYYYRNLPQATLDKISTLWSELKIASTENSDSYIIYILCITAVILLAGVVVFLKVRKRRRINA
ncbi:MAG: spermidine/putrescine ABC transporter substrate-binding protein [Eubacteriales bacterium]|nr:spermidine/putrescine ABC transporter substrate-binding protein [Eubacteriales bacterium]